MYVSSAQRLSSSDAGTPLSVLLSSASSFLVCVCIFRPGWTMVTVDVSVAIDFSGTDKLL